MESVRPSAHARPGIRAACLVAALAATFPPQVGAQLISPGKLSRAHAAVQGLEECTSCHALRQRGVAAAKCLKCHAVLAARIEASAGLHARYQDKPCTECHKEHFGDDLPLIRFDSVRFDHRETGFELRLAHGKVRCRECHAAENIVAADVRRYASEHGVLGRTYLGLDTACVSCHAHDGPHGDQFSNRGCEACHREDSWKKAAGFDHERTAYPLTGAHRTAACERCHPATTAGGGTRSVRYVGVSHTDCTACHRDPHAGLMRQRCEGCHTTEGWRQLDRKSFETRFDHTRTRFRLQGKHERLECAACHQPRSGAVSGIRMTFLNGRRDAAYPKPRAESCAACHLDRHDGVFADAPGGIECDNCHGQDAWLPTTYDLARHNRESFQLAGAHVAVACRDCHATPAGPTGALTFRMEHRDCRSCHAADNPHGEQFQTRACDECHSATEFRIAGFDHSKTRYPLDGAHRQVPCARCHPVERAPDGRSMVRYRPLRSSCRDCHGDLP